MIFGASSFILINMGKQCRALCSALLVIAASENHSLGEWFKRGFCRWGKNKTPSVIVEMRSGNCKLQNKGRPLKSE